MVLASILLIVLTVAWDQVPRFFLPLGAIVLVISFVILRILRRKDRNTDDQESAD